MLKSYCNNEQKARDLVGDYPEIYFTFKDKEYTSQTDINAGCKDWLQNGSDSSVSTIACMGTRITNSGTTERGLVVAGHAGNVGDTMKINVTTIGTITKRKIVGFLSGGDGTYSNFTKFTEFATAYNFTLV